MQLVRTVDVRTLLLHDEVLFQCFQELSLAQSVQVFDYAVVVDDVELIIGEANGQEEAVFLVAGMMGVLLLAFVAHQGGGSATVVSVSDVHSRNLSDQFGDAFDIIIVINDPELMAKAFWLGYEVVFGLFGSIASDDSIQFVHVFVGEEDGLDVGVVDAHVFHTVFLFVAACELVFLDAAGHIVFKPCSYYQAILRSIAHGLGIYVIAFFRVLNQPSVLLEEIKMLACTLIHLRIVLVGTGLEVDFGFDNVIQRFLVAGGFCAGFFAVQHVIRT